MHAEPLRINVKVYRLAFADAPQLSSSLDTPQINRMFNEVNRIWAPGGICWRLHSSERFDVDGSLSRAVASSYARDSLRAQLRVLLPPLPPVMARRLWRVALMRVFPVAAGGLYLPESGVIYCSERTPRGGITHTTLAHELGHSLGLRHVEAEQNLMNPSALQDINQWLEAPSGAVATCPSALDAAQIAAARTQLQRGPYRQTRERGW